MPRAARSRDLTIIGVATVAMVVVTAIGAWLSPPQGLDPRGSSYSTRADGGLAAFLLLKQLGYRVERSFEPLANAPLTQDPAHTTLIITSPRRGPSEQDRRALRRFVEAGGLVLATAADDAFFPGLKGAHEPDPFTARPKRAPYRPVPTGAVPTGPVPTGAVPAAAVPAGGPAAHPDPLTIGAPEIQIAPELIDVPADKTFTRIYESRDEQPHAGVMASSLGKGRIIWWAGSTPLTNAHISAPGSLELLLNAVGPRGDARLVLWDEYHHGVGRGLWSYVAGTPLWAALLQLMLLAAFALFTVSRRRGPVRVVVDPPRASALEFVFALGALYAKARAANGAVETARARVRRLLVSASRLSSRATDAELVAAVSGRFPLPAEPLDALLSESATAADTPALSPARALTLHQRLQDLAAVIRGRLHRS